MVDFGRDEKEDFGFGKKTCQKSRIYECWNDGIFGRWGGVSIFYWNESTYSGRTYRDRNGDGNWYCDLSDFNCRRVSVKFPNDSHLFTKWNQMYWLRPAGKSNNRRPGKSFPARYGKDWFISFWFGWWNPSGWRNRLYGSCHYTTLWQLTCKSHFPWPYFWECDSQVCACIKRTEDSRSKDQYYIFD